MKRMSFAVTMLFSMLVLIACAPVGAPAGDGTGDGAASEGDSNTITWAMWGSTAEIETHQAVADVFMEEHPDINVEIQSEPWGDYFTKLQTLWAGGNPDDIPDVFFVSFQIFSYAPDGLVEPLDSYIEASGYNTDDYWPSLLEFGTVDNTIYGLPRDIGIEVLYYNKDIFDEVGLSYPDDSWTWNDLRDAAEALTIVNDSGQVERYGLAMEAGKFQLWVGQNGGGILDDMRNPSACALDSAEAVEAIAFFSDMMENNFAMRSADLTQAGGDAGVFSSGQAAMIIQNSSRVSQFNEAEMNYDVAAIPIPDGGQRSGAAGGAMWAISAQSDNKDTAWTFVEWLQSTDGGQRVYTESGEILPALQSTAESDAFLGLDAAPTNRQAFITEGENAKIGRVGYFSEWNELNGTVLTPALDQIWAGEATPEELLPQLCEDVNTFLADNGFPK